MKKKTKKLSGYEKRKAARRRAQEEEYGRDEFLFGSEEDYENEEYYEDEEYSEYEDASEEEEPDYYSKQDYNSAEDEEYPEGEYDDEYEEEDELPEFDPDDPDFFTRDIDTDAVDAATKTVDSFGDSDTKTQNNGRSKKYAKKESDEYFEDEEYTTEHYDNEESVDEYYGADGNSRENYKGEKYSDEYYEEESDEYYEDDEYPDEYYEDDEYSDEYYEDEYYEDDEYFDEPYEQSTHKNKKIADKINKGRAKKAGVKYKGKNKKNKGKASKGRKTNNKGEKATASAKHNKRQGVWDATDDDQTGFFGRIVSFFTNMSVADRLIALTGVCVLIVAIVAGTLYFNARTIQGQIDEFATIGSNVADISIIGENGINSLASAKATFVAAPIEEEETFEEYVEEPEPVEPEVITITMNVSSIQSDLKIKFNSKDTGKLVTGIPFEINVKGDNGYEKNWKDENMDGLIYHTEVENGTYTVTMCEIDKEKYPDYIASVEPTKMKVTDQIAYKKVDVADEVKKESEINVAAEDTAVQDTAVESVLSDTVEWVESTKTLISGTEDGFESINKDQISVPSASINKNEIRNADIRMISYTYEMPFYAVEGANSPADNPNGNVQDPAATPQTPAATPLSTGISDTTVTATEGDSGKTLTATATGGSGTYTYTWSSSDTSVVDVSGSDASGAISFKGKGTATVTVVIKDTVNGTEETKTCSVTVNEAAAKDPATPSDPSKPSTPETPKESALSTGVSPNNVSAKAGDANKTIVASATGGNGSYTYTWSSSDTSIANVSGSGTVGTIGFGKAGTATITVTITGTVNGETVTKTETCTVTVGEAEKKVDQSALLSTTSGKQVYVKNASGGYDKATVADYSSKSEFYVQSDSGSNAVYKYTGWQTIDGNTYFFDKDGNYVTGEQVIQGAKYNFDSNGHLSSSSGTMGIDVSKWNGSIDWNAVKNAGVSYVIIRCGYRGSTTGALIEDPKFRANISGAKAAGLKVGAYFFTQAVNEVEAVEEASMAVSLCSGYGLNLPIFLDVESSKGRGDGIDAGTRTAVIKAFCQTVQNSGYSAGVYANKIWLTNYMNASALTAYKIWLAQYAAAPTYSATRIDYWQYTSKGSIPGISGNVDINLKY